MSYTPVRLPTQRGTSFAARLDSIEYSARDSVLVLSIVLVVSATEAGIGGTMVSAITVAFRAVRGAFLRSSFYRWIASSRSPIRMISKRGFVARNTAKMNMTVESVQVDQSVLSRLLSGP